MDYTTIPLKVCTKCHRLLPATTFFFYRDKSHIDGLGSRCKTCVILDSIDQRAKNKDKKAEYDRKRYIQQQETKTQRSSEWYQNNHERAKATRKAYRKKNNQRWNEYHTLYNQKRRARKRNMPDTFTDAQWIACLEYFNYRCAVCGIQLRDLFGNVSPHRDHWIPLNNAECPGTIAINVVCLCSGCNKSKQDTLPADWLTKKHGTRKAKQILDRIQAYFASLGE